MVKKELFSLHIRVEGEGYDGAADSDKLERKIKEKSEERRFFFHILVFA